MKKTPEEILAEIQPIFQEVLDVENLTLTPETVANDIEEWDSLSHIQLVMAIGRHYNIRFTTQEIVAWKTVADIIQSILTHLG